MENQVTGAHPNHDWAKVLATSSEAFEVAIYLWTKCTFIDSQQTSSICILPNTGFPLTPSMKLSLMFFQLKLKALLHPDGIIEEWFRLDPRKLIMHSWVLRPLNAERRKRVHLSKFILMNHHWIKDGTGPVISSLPAAMSWALPRGLYKLMYDDRDADIRCTWFWYMYLFYFARTLCNIKLGDLKNNISDIYKFFHYVLSSNLRMIWSFRCLNYYCYRFNLPISLSFAEKIEEGK